MRRILTRGVLLAALTGAALVPMPACIGNDFPDEDAGAADAGPPDGDFDSDAPLADGGGTDAG
jgi:hypothetical protein